MADSRATSFGAQAQDYEVGRPEYPFDAVAWMLEILPAGAQRVADVGAGTGKLTRAIAHAPGAQIVAIDPDPAMLAALRENVPGVPTFLGTAESLPLPDDSLDAVVLGQAWHWVDPVRASAEIGRAVRADGALGLIWNIRDERVEWVRDLSRIMHRSAAEEALAAGPCRRRTLRLARERELGMVAADDTRTAPPHGFVAQRGDHRDIRGAGAYPQGDGRPLRRPRVHRWSHQSALRDEGVPRAPRLIATGERSDEGTRRDR